MLRNVETTLINVDDQRCFNVDSTLMCLLGYYRQGKHLKIRYLRKYSHVLYRISTRKKSERFDSLPYDFIVLPFDFFFGQAISQNSSIPLILKGFYLLRMSNDYRIRRAVQAVAM